MDRDLAFKHGEIFLSGYQIGRWHRRAIDSGVIVTFDGSFYKSRGLQAEGMRTVTRRAHENLYQGSLPVWNHDNQSSFQIELMAEAVPDNVHPARARYPLGSLDDQAVAATVRIFTERVRVEMDALAQTRAATEAVKTENPEVAARPGARQRWWHMICGQS